MTYIRLTFIRFGYGDPESPKIANEEFDMAVTDHNTIRGALEAKKFENDTVSGNHWLGIRTDIGDIIGLNRKVERILDMVILK